MNSPDPLAPSGDERRLAGQAPPLLPAPAARRHSQLAFFWSGAEDEWIVVHSSRGPNGYITHSGGGHQVFYAS